METKIRVLFFPVGKAPEWIELDPHDISELQARVGGYVEVVRFGSVDLWCNEEGRLQGLRHNGVVAHNVPGGSALDILGPFVLAGRRESDDGDMMDVLPDDWQDHVKVLARRET